MRSIYAFAIGGSLFVLSPGLPAHADAVRNALTNNALTNNALTNNAITSNALTNNAITSNAITANALGSTGVAVPGGSPAIGTGVADLNGVAVDAVVLPETVR